MPSGVYSRSLEYRKKLSEVRKGKNSGALNSQYIDGRSSKKYFCKCCGKKISYVNFLYGSKKCQSCSKLGHPSYTKFGKQAPRYKNGCSLRIYKCHDCGKIISQTSGYYGGGKCRVCYVRGTRGKWVGKNNPNWKNGITPKVEQVRKSIEYRLWRESVFARDHWNCQNCGNGGYLHAHHIKPFSKYPELRLALDNGITLCKHCHKKIHGLKPAEITQMANQGEK